MTRPRATTHRIWQLHERDAVTAIGQRLVDCTRIRVTRTLHRAVYTKYLDNPSGARPEPLYYRGSLTGRRYTPPGGPAGLYLSYDPATPAAELRLVVFECGFPVSTTAHDPVTTVAVQAKVGRILDLTDPQTRRRLHLTKGMLRADWETHQERYLDGEGPMPATQLLALAAHALGTIGGIKYPSARTRFGQNLVVFPDRLRGRVDLLEVVDSTGRNSQRLP